MAYSLCVACGAKTLVGATRCPRCQTPLVSYAPGSERPETVRCQGCGVLRPSAIGVCPNCHAGPESPNKRSARGLMLAGGVIVLILVGGFAITQFSSASRDLAVANQPTSAPDTNPVASAAPISLDSIGGSRENIPPEMPLDSTRAPISRSRGATAVVQAAPRKVEVPKTAPMGPPKTAPASITTPAPAPAVTLDAQRAARLVRPAADSSWSYWRATTWVRLRDKPGRNGDEVRMIDSSQRVLLGPSMNGWRAARVGTDQGWVDPRLFVPATKP